MRAKHLRPLLILLANLAILYAVLALFAERAPSHPMLERLPTRPLVIAHQGGDGLWPSNTIRAFEGAANLGVDVLEMDIHMTADGVIVVMHDATVDRTTDGRGEIRAMTFAELQALDAGFDWTPDEGATYPFRGQGITVPALETILLAFPDLPLNIEIKQAEPSMAQPFCDLLREHGRTQDVLVPSFSAEVMREFRQACPDVATVMAEDEVRPLFILSTIYLSELYSPAAQAVQVPESRGGIHVLTPAFVAGAHQRGLEIHAWTVNEVDDMERILALGVDGIITDYPDRLLELLGR
jgi:glycerophosphoryl diester phosphodiesterase